MLRGSALPQKTTPPAADTGRAASAGRAMKPCASCLWLGATAVIRFARPGHASPWLLNLLARKPKKLAAIVLANKMARTLWAMMVSGKVYRRLLPA